MNSLSEIQNWYLLQCNQNWEHEFGIKINTLDNPGWHIEVDLTGTNLENKNFQEMNIDKSDNNWFVCRVSEKKFEAFGDAQKLETLLRIFLDWSKNSSAKS